ncbi:hypothetical protein [Nitrosomonas ureae]|nr:hypothetical protein [Nitrosomonas ureae]
MNFEKMSDQQLWDIANPIMDNLMDASIQLDHTKHVRDFTERMKVIVTPEYLYVFACTIQPRKGISPAGCRFVLFRRPDSVAIVWKQSFTKVLGEYVAEMVLVYKNDRYLVDHVMVF